MHRRYIKALLVTALELFATALRAPDSLGVPPREERGVRPYGAEEAPRSRAKSASRPMRVAVLDAGPMMSRLPAIIGANDNDGHHDSSRPG